MKKLKKGQRFLIFSKKRNKKHPLFYVPTSTYDDHIVTVYGHGDDIDVEHPDSCHREYLTDKEYWGEDCPSDGWQIVFNCILSYELENVGFELLLEEFLADCEDENCASWNNQRCYKNGVYVIESWISKTGTWEFTEYEPEYYTYKMTRLRRFLRAIQFQVGLR